MKKRNLIKSQIIKAWEKSINIDYSNQRINSERSLQAAFWSHLNHLISKNRRLFIEPCMTISTKKGKKKIYPDIVVCNTKQVISVIELKYLPRTNPKYTSDIKKLAMIAKNRRIISIANVRFRGTEKDSREYTLSKNILFVWAGIHTEQNQNNNTLYSNGYKSLENCYLQLHAETEFNSKPKIYVKTN
jgi:hypothetical protein